MRRFNLESVSLSVKKKGLKKMSKIYDLLIVGSGPAGLTAAIYASRAELDVAVIERNSISGGQIINTYEVDNYPGIPGISGYDLAVKFREHCDRLNVTFLDGEVKSSDFSGEVKKLELKNGDVLEAKSVIVAAGAKPRKLGVPGETELSGMGVSYCATCDGAFFRNRVTVVVGGGDVAVEDAIFLSRLCKKVYVIHRRDEFRAAKTLVTQLKSKKNIEVIWNSVVEKIEGDDMVESVIVNNVKTGENNLLTVNAVFIAVGYESETGAYKGEVELDNVGYIVAGENCETSVPGVFAAGDVRAKQLKQIITAAADGANAVTSLERYFNSL